MAPIPRAQASRFSSTTPETFVSQRSIGDFMTHAPHSIGADQMLSVAHEMMRKHRIRHLPVLRGGRLVGVLSQRDLYRVETLRDVDPEHVRTEEAMSESVYSVSPKTSLGVVAKEMSERGYGCAVVVERNKLVGIFTTSDALKALAAEP